MAWERSFHRHHPAVSVDVPRSHRASVLFGRRDPCAIRVRVPARSSARCAGGRNETGSKRRVHNFAVAVARRGRRPATACTAERAVSNTAGSLVTGSQSCRRSRRRGATGPTPQLRARTASAARRRSSARCDGGGTRRAGAAGRRCPRRNNPPGR